MQSVSTSRETSRGLAKKWPEIKQQLEFLGRYLSKGYLVRAITILSESRKRRFLRNRLPKYGTMNKGFTDEELGRFFGVMDDAKMRLLFSYQAILGLRIGEAIRLNIKDINLTTRELRILTEKSRKVDYLIIPQQLFDITIGYIKDFENSIKGFFKFITHDEVKLTCSI